MSDILYDFVFHYNIYTNLWAAIPRELYTKYWEDYSNPGILRSSKLETLIELILKTEGKTEEIEILTNDNTLH